MNLALSYACKDARVWAYGNHSFDVHLNHLGSVSCPSPPPPQPESPQGVVRWLQWLMA